MRCLQRLAGVPLLCNVDAWFVAAAVVSVGCWEIAANVRRFCTLIGPSKPADAADKFAVEGTVLVCGVVAVSVWAPKPAIVKRNLTNYSSKFLIFWEKKTINYLA